MLAETGLTLGVCEWGYCVYREEASACHGSATAPDPVQREPSMRTLQDLFAYPRASPLLDRTIGTVCQSD